jgi:CRP-like cAMP-binding protein
VKLTLQKEIQILKEVSLFRSMKTDELKILAFTAKNYIFEPGEIIVNEGDEGDEAFIIYSGQVEVSRRGSEGGSITLNILGAGDMFGELALFGEGFRTATVKAIEETFVAVISKERLYEIIREFPDIGIEMLRVQTQRFRMAENRLIDHMGKK